eukprot:Tamp_04874.p1 GENE.Tamp_04874~~Tamp_04874.p1  ORF type:complete len:973 (-),score=164.66 Tamp_04874:223-2871(-)
MAVEGYRTPAQAMVDLVDAKPSPSMSVQPSAAGAKWVLLMQQSAMLELADLAQEELKLAGTRLLAHYDVPSRQMGYQTVTLLHRETRQEYEVEGLPAGRIFNVRWSPTGRRVGLTVLTSEGLFLYTFTPEERKASRAFDGRLSSAFASSFCWIAGGEGVLVNSVPRDRGALPQRPAVPGAPLVQECAAGTKAPARTYQDLLVDAHDEALFRHFCTTQVVLVDLTGATPPRSIGKPAMVVYFKAAPGKELALVEALQEPLSRVVLWSRFAKDVTVFSLSSGEEHKRMAALPLADSMPIGRDACRTGPRRHAWRPDEPGTLWWVEALDNGDPKAVVAHRDALFIQNLVDGSDPVELARTQYRFSDVWWGGGSLDPWGGWPGAAEEGPGRQDVALARENDWKTRQSRVWQILPGCSASDASRRCPRPLLQYRSEDRYKHPGSPMSVITAADSTVMRRDPSGRVFFAGTGGSEDGDRPFLDLRPLFPRHLAQVPDYAAQSAEAATEADESEGAAAAAGGERQGEVVRLWRCAVGVYESIQNVVQVEPGRQEQGPEADTVSLLTTRETQTETPQLVERSLRISDAVAGAGADTDSPDPAGEAITAFPHPQPALLGVKKELIKYNRTLDGLELSGMLYTPAGYEATRDGPLPTLLWAYPREYKTAASAAQVTGSPYKFILVPRTSPLLWLTRGFAVLDNPSMPIVGENGEEENDRFVEQLVANAEAAVSELVRRGVSDERVAVGGHSYGAFMATNLLAHSRLFQAGIGRSGAYNRLLTPFGFQSEERTLWEAPEVYMKMSPFAQADKIDTPLLLLHGAQDNNPGTLPLQSERLYSALKGLGKDARLVILPLESHSYQARESVLHMLWEMDQWLSTHLSNSKEATPPPN